MKSGPLHSSNCHLQTNLKVSVKDARWENDFSGVYDLGERTASYDTACIFKIGTQTAVSIISVTSSQPNQIP